jgi:hypothetical protein
MGEGTNLPKIALLHSSSWLLLLMLPGVRSFGGKRVPFAH